MRMLPNRTHMLVRTAAVSIFTTLCLSGGATAKPIPNAESWLQWGGPNHNFMIDGVDLADTWPEGGPKKLWHRELGDGYSTILADAGLLYTMYRVDQDEITVALDAKSGKTVWEHKHASPTTPLMEQFGAGPHTTPAIAGDLLFTIGSNAMMHCYDKKSGNVVWKHDLAAEFGAPIPGRGYGASPFVYKNTVIVPVDRARGEDEDDADTTNDQTLVAFDVKTGDIAWKAQDYATNYATPMLINYEGQKQLVLLMTAGIMGVNPTNGSLLWHLEFDAAGANISTPVWDGKDTFFCSAAYASGSRGIKLSKQDGKTVAEQIWYSRKMRVHHGNVIRLGEYVYGSTGDFGPAFLMAMNMQTGKVTWRERGFKKANTVYADGKMIVLDEDGKLALATVTPEAFTLLSSCTVAETYAWAAPTLIGKTLYVRDRRHIMALDVG